MTALTPAAALALALQCVPPSVAPIMVGIAQHESGLDPVAIHRNANGTLDVGLAQVNSANFGWLGLTLQTALDPCRNLAAGARVLLARYNGNPLDSVKAAYAAGVTARIRALGDVPSTPPSSPPDPPVIYAKPAKHAGRDLVYGN
jgi:soluble lytic murein transglycosylase-like protein